MKIYLDVETPHGVTIGDGPIGEVEYWILRDRLDRDGEFYGELPATIARVDALKAKRVVSCYGLDEELGRIDLGVGELQEITTILQGDQPPRLAIRGSGRMRELVSAVVPPGTAYEESRDVPATLINVFASEDQLPGAWRLSGATQTLRAITLELLGDNVLEAFILIANTIGEHFRRGEGDREIVWIGSTRDLEDSGITATTEPYRGRNPDICKIIDLEPKLDAWELCNRAFGYGVGEAEKERITLKNATKWPDGADITGNTHVLDGQRWTIDRENNLLINDASIAEYFPQTRTKTFTELRVEESTTAAAASNVVLQALYNWMRTRGQPALFCNMRLDDMDGVLLPGQRIRVVARWLRDGQMPLNIDEDMYILEAANEADRLGVRTVRIYASTVDRWLETGDDLVLGASLGSPTSAANIIGVGHTHAQYAPIGHAHPATEHDHGELKADGSVRLQGDLRPDRDNGHRLGRDNERIGEIWARDVTGNVVRAYRAVDGLNLADNSNVHGLKVRDGRVYIGDLRQTAGTDGTLEVNGDMVIRQSAEAPAARSGVVKLAALEDGRLVAILPDGTIFDLAPHDHGGGGGPHTHPDLSPASHGHNELRKDGSIPLEGTLTVNQGANIAFQTDARSNIGASNRRAKDVFTRALTADHVRARAQNRGIRITDFANNDGIRVHNGNIYIGPFTQINTAVSKLQVNGDIGLNQLDAAPGPSPSIAKLYATSDNKLRVVFPDGTDLQVFVA